MKFGGGARSLAAKRRGPNYKATCATCGKGIANRMMMATSCYNKYYHSGCVPKQDRHNEARFIRVW